MWLFSSGPLGTEPADAQGRDLTVAAEPKEIAEFTEAIHPRGHRVFFGVLEPGGLGLGERAMRKLQAGRALLPEGDFRDWAQIEAWARGIARDPALGAGGAGGIGAEQLTDNTMPAFDALPVPQPEVPAVPAAGAAQGPQLLIDQFLPRYDFAVVHAQVFRVPPEVCLRRPATLTCSGTPPSGCCWTCGHFPSVPPAA